MFKKLGETGLVLALTFAGADAFAEPDYLDRAYTLLHDDQYEQAYKLLERSITPEDQANPEVMLAFANASRNYAPLIDPANGGDRARVELFQNAGELYQAVLATPDADSIDQTIANAGLATVKNELLKEGSAAMDTGSFEHVARVGEAMAKLWPKQEIGPMLIAQAGGALQSPNIQMRGLRLLIRAESRRPEVYSLAAMLEQSEPQGGGADAALRHIEAGLGVIGEDIALLETRAQLLIEAGRLDEARATAARMDAAAQSETNEQWRATLMASIGAIYDRLGDADVAEARYRWAAERQPTNAQVRAMLGSVYVNRAAEAIRKANDLPLNADVAERRELEGRAKRNLELARTELEAAHEYGELDLTVMMGLSNVYAQLGDDEAALKMQREIRKLRHGE